MKTEDTVEYNSLRWVKKELDLILSEAQSALSLYIEEKDNARLRECTDHLHMVHGTLQMVELYGAAQLSEEMYKLSVAIDEQTLASEEDAYDVLMRSMLQLPDYLESLQAGSKDVPMVLLPLMNDLRASRNASLLSENVLFFPDIDAEGGQPEKAEVVSGQLQAMAKKLRPHYQIGLVGWFRGQKVRASQKRILAVLEEFERVSSDPSSRRLWSISAAVIEGLMLDTLDSSVSVKMLMGQVDRNIHHLIKQGEIELAKDLPAELLKNLLYYVARIEQDSKRVAKVKETYRLKELLPNESELEKVRSGLGGLNTELLRTVSQGIREDLLEVKDALEIFAHSDDRSIDRLTSMPSLLNKIADTLAMLGLGGSREEVLSQKDIIENIVAGNQGSSNEDVMSIASVLLGVESQLNNFIASRSSSEEEVQHRVGNLANMPEGEYREVLAAVIGEALRDFNAAKQAILDYLDDTSNTGLLKTVYEKISVVCGAMFMLPLDRLEPQLNAVLDYIEIVLIKAGQVPDPQAQDELADVITSIEYYLEAVLEGRPDIDSSFATGDEAAQKLIETTATFSDDLQLDTENSIDSDDEISIGDINFDEDVDTSFDENIDEDVDTLLDENIEIDEPSIDESSSDEVIEIAVDKALIETDNISVTTMDAEELKIDENRFVILGDDADEEILEIFIEEAIEVLESLNEQLPLWINNTSNEDAQTIVRRSFHTLKGSGRLIGAQLIGEFSWSMENILNKIIDNTRPADDDVFETLTEAVSILPQLIEQLKGNREPIKGIYQLIDKAERLAKKRESVEPTEIKEDEDDKILDEALLVEESDEVAEEDESLLDELAIEEDESLLDELAIEEDDSLLDELVLEESIDESTSEELVLDEAADTSAAIEIEDADDESEIDFQLDEDESFSIDILEDELQLAEDAINLDGFEVEDSGAEDADVELEASVDEATSEGLNTESENTAEQQILKADQEVAAVDDIVELNSLDDLDIEDDFNIDLTEDLEELQLAVSSDEYLAEEAEAADETTEVEELIFESDVSNGAAEDYEPKDFAADEDVLAIHADPVLFEIYNKESTAHIEQLRDLISKHKQNEEALTVSPELIRALHTLYGSARTAEVEEIAELSGALEKYIRALQTAEIINIDTVAVDLIEQCVDAISDMLVALADPKNHITSEHGLLGRIDNLQVSIGTAQSNRIIDQVAQQDFTQQDEHEDVSLDEEVASVETELETEAQIEIENELKNIADTAFTDYGDVDDELVDIFLEEAEELVDNCENSLQQWNNDHSDIESVNDLQRLLHTLKGGARMADLAPIGDLTHALESLIIAANNDQVEFSKIMSAKLHETMDALSDMLAKVKVRGPISSPEKLILDLESLRKGEPLELEVVSEVQVEDDGLELQDTHSIDENDVAETAEENANDDLQIDEGITEDIIEDIIDIPAVEDNYSADETETFTLSKDDTIELTDAEENKATIAHEQVRVRSDILNELVNNAGEVSVYHARMGQQVSSFSYTLSEMEQTVVRLREQLRNLSIETEAQILSRYEKESDQYDADFDPLEMDRFSTMQQISRSLSETVGDIESIKNILYEQVRDAETLLLQESRVSTELQEGLMRTRMVHFGGLASRLRRIVRQTSRELGKDAELEIVGETTEVDRTVLDRIIAPLEHMLRNGVSHGIELPDERVAKGKVATGHIRISVDREGSDVVIKVEDDGKGIDVNAIRKHALDTGLLSANIQLGDHEILQFIMEPGFSTVAEVTQISGRGVGMDVVDREIKQLGGVFEIDTVIGKGTAFTVRLPLTLAINHALLVNVGEDVYAVPLSSIEGVVRLNGPDLQAFYDGGDSTYEFAGTEYELRHLGNMLHGSQPNYARSGQLFPVLLARVGEQRVALHVDELVGRREIVVKPVGPQINTVRGVSGATILGDGRVVLILEMNALVLGESLFHVSGVESEEHVLEAPVVEEDHEILVMVVDDSITIRKVTERILLRHNIRVITAKDGVDAVAQLQEQLPDVMLLDIEMPRMDGYEVATHVRNDERLKDLPIIMITSRTGTKHREKAMAIGVNKYLGKPYQEDELMATINELIG